MSISYSALTNHGKITLPSIESWGTNMSLLKDPPKSLFTRRVKKVGQTSDITAMIDDATDRACETIRQYSRGVNPSVSVQYNNSKAMNGNTFQSGNNQAFLPYRIARDGAFRAPVRTQYDLLPLSRQPRIWTSSFSNPGFADFSKKAINQGTAETTREVRNSTLNVSARPTAVYKIATPLDKPYEVKYVIQPTLQKSAQTQIRTTDRTVQNVLEPTKEINKNINHAFAQSNVSDNNKFINKNRLNTDKYIQDTNAHSVDTIKGSNYIQIGSLDDFIDMGNVRTKDAVNIDYQTQLKGNEKTEYIHGDLFQERNLPYYSAESNMKGDSNQVTYIHDDMELERVLPYYSAESNMKGDSNQVTYIHNDMELDRVLPYYSAESNMKGDSNQVTYIHDDMELDRVLPYYSADSNIKGETTKFNYIHEDLQRNRNIPEYNIAGIMKGNEKVSYIHNDIELDRVLPEYQANTMKTQQNLQKQITPEYVREMIHNVPAVKDVYINKAGTGESNTSSRSFQLADKLQPGSYHIRGQIPNQQRITNVKENFQSDKSVMGKKVMDQHMDRFGSFAPFDPRFRN